MGLNIWWGYRSEENLREKLDHRGHEENTHSKMLGVGLLDQPGKTSKSGKGAS